MKKYPLFDRDLSWLSFNYRVLMEAKDQRVPLMERLRFMAIYSSNLDEFFRVRVANMRQLMEIGKKKINKKLALDPWRVFKAIHQEVDFQLAEYGEVLTEILKALKEQGLHIIQAPEKISEDAELNHYFKTRILAFLRPKLLLNGKLPFLNNRALYFGLRLRKKNKEYIAVLNIPSNNLPRFYKIQKPKNTVRYYFIDDIIRMNLDAVFPDFEVLECCSFKLNKDADLHIEDEYRGDLIQKIRKQIRKRNLGDPSRFLYDQDFSEPLLNAFVDAYSFRDEDLVSGARYHNLNDFFQIRDVPEKKLEYEKLLPVSNSAIDRHKNLLSAIEHEDQLLHFPYQSYDYVLQFFNEAAIDPDVKEINVTFYRMAESSRIANALMSAAANGKKVLVFMEVKARFDEENNLRWASKMRDAGIKIHYSLPGIKVHAKIAQIRKVRDGAMIYYGFLSTGNMNESTAKTYCDFSLLTCQPQINSELKQVFRFLHKQKPPGVLKHLIVSQFGALERFESLIDREIKNKQAGKKASILIKLNNLEEAGLITRLYQAAESGVEIRLLIRGICCLVPDTGGIEVTRIVDRYLEHARLFYFYNDGKEDLFMGSSDWMIRNLHRRIEVTLPIHHPPLKKQLLDILKIQLADNYKRVRLTPAMKNEPVKPTGNTRAQMEIYTYLKSLADA